MRRSARLLRTLAILLVATAAGAALSLAWLVRRNLPPAEGARLPGLSSEVRVAFDDRGVATVTAASVADALRVQGYLTARERAFQLELSRRAASGALAELFGKAALPLDRERRVYGFARVAEAAVPLLPEDERRDLEALADGINAYFRDSGGRCGLEFGLLRVAPRPFRPADSLLVLLLMWEELTSTWEKERDAAALASVPPSLRAFLLPRATRDDVVLVPDAARLLPPGLPVVEPGNAGPAAPAADDADDAVVAGSNGWAVSGALTASGKPLLANDPHLGHSIPGIWLPMRFAIGSRLVEGATIPGLPGVVLGRNDSVAWAFTNLMADEQDLYRETREGDRVRRGDLWEPVTRRQETVRLRGGGAERFWVEETSIGPVVAPGLALKWTALDPANLRLPTAQVMLAASPEELASALGRFAGPPQNVVWASRDGRVGWRAAGLLPIRRPGSDGSLPYDGSDPEDRWRGFVPDEEMPRLVDPPEGFVVTANQRTIGTSFPVPVASDWASPTRARRILALLREARDAGRKLDRAAMEAIQLDAVSAPLAELAGAFRPHLPADLAAAFAGWDGRAAKESPLFLVARSLRRTLRREALAAWKVVSWRRNLDEEIWNDLLAADDAAFRRAGLGEKRELLARVAKATLAELAEAQGSDWRSWRWGKANALAVRHPIGRVPGLSWLFDPPAPPQDGAPQVVRASGRGSGPSMRFVLDWGAPEEATLVVPFGVSGHVGSPHRLDQLRAWLDGDPGGGATRLARPAAGAPLVFRP